MEERSRPAAKRPFIELRSRVLTGVRAFFLSGGFTEVQTPVLTPAPAPELHIEAVPADGDKFLSTSPELYMKRLLAEGYEKIFQISPVFRRGERGRLHLPEFHMLEWYRLGADYKALQHDCLELLRSVGRAVEFSKTEPNDGGGTPPSLFGEWERLTVREAFLRYAGWEPGPDPDPDRFDMDMVEKVEPRLGFSSPCILEDYPAGMAALARLKPEDPTVAERFELYWAGIELANGFSELTDPVEQRTRFLETAELRARAGLQPYPLPERFLGSLEHLGPCAGIALGIDRLVMLLAGASGIDEVTAFPPEWA